MALEKMNREARGGICGNLLSREAATCMEPSIAGAKRQLSETRPSRFWGGAPRMTHVLRGIGYIKG